MDHLQRIIRSAVHGFEAGHHERIYSRLSDVSQTAIDRLVVSEEPDTQDSGDSKSAETSHRIRLLVRSEVRPRQTES